MAPESLFRPIHLAVREGKGRERERERERLTDKEREVLTVEHAWPRHR